MPWKFDDSSPIYMQLMSKIKVEILSGRYKAGDKLKSVREMAGEACVNPNTMQKALTELESTGLIYSRRTAGRFITEDTTMIKAMRNELAQEEVKSFLNNMKTIGVTKEEIINMVENIEKGME